MTSQHTFHIPVMGTAFTADSPLKVAHYGINTVIALADDVLLERLRKYYSELYNLSYKEIKNDTKDYRADRITSYLNMVNKVASARFEEFTSATKDKFEEVKKYFGKDVFKTIIPRNVRLSEAPSHGLPAILYDINSSGSQAYISLAKEMIKRIK